MKLPKIFITFTFLLAFAFQVSAQDKIDPNITKQVFDALERKIKGLKIGDLSPNELKDYSFFKEGKLKELKLGISNKENVKEVFGKDCESDCEYDKDWKVFFTYFYNIKKEIINNGQTTKYIRNPKLANNLYSVKLVPKDGISFSKITFSDEFHKFSSLVFGHDFSGNGIGTAIDYYTDSYGLRYTVFDKVNYSTLNEKDKRLKGDLISIEYTIPKEVEEKLFVEQK